jgi:hypothetical protein
MIASATNPKPSTKQQTPHNQNLRPFLAQQAGNYKRAANSFSPFRRARQPLGGYENLALQKRKLTAFVPPFNFTEHAPRYTLQGFN